MSHIRFQTPPTLPVPRLGSSQPMAGTLWRKTLTVTCSSSSSLIDGGNHSKVVLERCFKAPSALPSGSTVEFGPVMKGQFGSLGAVTLEKGKLEMSQKQSESSPDSRGDEGGLFRRRKFLEELFDRKFVDAVLNEWQRTMMDLPAGLRQAYEMGLVSSAQLVKFLAINARPTTTRFISRSLPQGLSRAFIGRTIADPSFLYKLPLEQVATISSSVWWELKNRGDRIKQEWDLALINVLTVTACNAFVVWSLAPCRSYGNTFRFDLQNTLQKLPNNIFERSYPLREFYLQKRIHSLFYKAAELCLVGLTAGAVQGSLSNLLGSKKKERLSVTVLITSTNALGYGAFLGLYANLRYQLLCGFDRAVTNHFDVIGVALFLSTSLRILNVQVGERSRLAWLGVEADPLVQSDDLLKAYNWPAEDVAWSSSSKWFISENAIVSGLGRLGFKQGNGDSGVDGDAARAPKAHRKSIVRKKVSASSA
ncbi:hypothetical protein Dsin_005799 [Dipteronia sinensis]|uniref:Protein RETICULATA-RELATED 1, chloroplastic-like n=1 Tax=Dipteronia sinensis TaxID=43782 RepID=A0AAE0EFJ4_9ROSI|nr:hypothetical protein Dsin_005799 [Dipteronia sinensis]